MSSIASSDSTSSQVDFQAPAFKIYRNFKDQCEDDWDGDVYPNQTLHAREIDGEPAPPYIVVVQGPPNVGKSLLIKSLVNYFTNVEEHNMDDIRGPITIRTGDKRRRLQFVECADDINVMVDAEKYADLVLLLVDASYGFEAETFEFLNLLQAHGFSNVMGVLTHLDEFKDETDSRETIVRLQDQFWTEICQGATVSYLSGLEHDLYKRCEVQQLAKDILMPQFILSSWRAAHPYVLVHIAGVGDFHLAGVRSITNPVPSLSEMEKESDLVELNHMENESFRTGTYLRLEVHSVPSRLVENLDPCRPILVGGISPEEENVGHMQARLKRHKWHMKLLKSADPVIVSAGWRRYQTRPIYASDNARHTVLDFISNMSPVLRCFVALLHLPIPELLLCRTIRTCFE
ncbi:ribosome biogenesis protein BMS1 homolog isoform X2 [Papaver somniferum]|nr:ribosome biogenesis protein BMS1 homolog isoform X2 [Papaver somniferum]